MASKKENLISQARELAKKKESDLSNKKSIFIEGINGCIFIDNKATEKEIELKKEKYLNKLKQFNNFIKTI